MFENEQMKKQEFLPSGGVTTLRRGRSRLSKVLFLKDGWRGLYIGIRGWGVEGGVGKYLLSTELNRCCKTLPSPKLYLRTLKNDLFLGLNSSFESFMQKNSKHWETGYGRLCFFFLDNTITSFKCLKLADILRRSQGIYTPSKNCHCFWCPRCHN